MAKAPKSVQEETPKEFPEVTPGYGHSVGQMHLVESMMQIQQSIGELKSDVRHLKDASDDQGRKLDRISHIIYAAGAVLAVVTAVVGFFLNKIWDGVFVLLNAAS